jgi:hypothetical protein
MAAASYRAGTHHMVKKGPFASFPAIVDQVRPNSTVASLIDIFDPWLWSSWRLIRSSWRRERQG